MQSIKDDLNQVGTYAYGRGVSLAITDSTMLNDLKNRLISKSTIKKETGFEYNHPKAGFLSFISSIYQF